MYFPWMNLDLGYPAGVPVKNAILTDTVSQFWIWRNWAVEGLKNSEVRLWNPYSLSGYPVSPWFQTILLSPLNIFYWLTDKVTAMGLIVMAQIPISLAGMYLLGKRWWKEDLSAWGMALAWTMSSYFVGWMTWGTVSMALAVLPWVLLTLGSKWAAGMLVMLILSGHPQTIFYAFLIIGIYGLVNRVGSRKMIWSFGVGLGLTAMVWWPSIPIIRDSIRFDDVVLTEMGNNFIGVGKLLTTLWSASFFGNPGTNNYWGGEPNFLESLVNFGIWPLFGVIYFLTGIVKKRKWSAWEKLGVICVITGWLLATRYPVGWLIYALKIPLLSTGSAGRAWIMAVFGGCVIFGEVLSQWQRGVDQKRWWVTTMVMAVWLALILCPIVGKGEMANIAMRNTTVEVTILGIGWLAMRWRKWGLWVVVGLVLVDGWWFFRKYTPFVDRDLYFPTTPTIEFLKRDENTFRVERESAELMPANMWHEYGLMSTSGYDPMYPKDYSQYLIDRGVRSVHGRYVENGNKNIDKLDGLGIKYLLVLERDGKWPIWVDKSAWREVYREGKVITLENTSFQPPYRMIGKGKVDLIKWQDGEIVLETETEKLDQLVVMTNYSDNWRVVVNGRLVSPQKFENAFILIDQVAGENRTEMKYVSREWREGWVIAVIAAIAWMMGVKYIRHEN